MSVTQQYSPENNTLTISINGKFNFDIHSEFRDTFQNIKPDNKLIITVDLRNTEYMDSAALGMLLLLDEHFSGQRISITNCSTYIKQILKVANFHQKFNID